MEEEKRVAGMKNKTKYKIGEEEGIILLRSLGFKKVIWFPYSPCLFDIYAERDGHGYLIDVDGMEKKKGSYGTWDVAWPSRITSIINKTGCLPAVLIINTKLDEYIFTPLNLTESRIKRKVNEKQIEFICEWIRLQKDKSL